MAVSQSKPAWINAKLGDLVNLGVLFWLHVCGSIVAFPKIYRPIPSPFRFEIRQWELDLKQLHKVTRGNVVMWPSLDSTCQQDPTGLLFGRDVARDQPIINDDLNDKTREFLASYDFKYYTTESEFQNLLYPWRCVSNFFCSIFSQHCCWVSNLISSININNGNLLATIPSSLEFM